MLKRVFDFSVALLAILVLSPVLLVVSLLIARNMGRPVLFKQARPGLNEGVFFIYKFRSMSNARDENGNLLADNERITNLGRFLRSTSIDELPSLWSVLVGDMSLVGPRPLLVEYLERYTPEQARRHSVKPGITGWAQIGGRNAISWDEKFRLDVWYVDKQSFWLDIKILLVTMKRVLSVRPFFSMRSMAWPVSMYTS